MATPLDVLTQLEAREPADEDSVSSREAASASEKKCVAHITLVRPPILQLPSSLSYYGAVLPIGIAYVAAVLRDAGHRVDIIDAPGEALDRFQDVDSPVGTLLLNGLTVNEIVERIDPRTEVLGITHMFLHEWPVIKEIAERAKARLPHITVVLGGENATAFWKWIFSDTSAVDYCVLGEGEATMLELVARRLADLPIDDLPGVACRDGQDARSSGLPQRLTKVDRIPRPAWELFPVTRYMSSTDNYGVHRGRSIPMLASRGCPYRCTFCSSPQMWTTRYMTREPQEVVDEMKFYVAQYGIENVNFVDLTAIIKKEWIVEFCHILERENLGITWQLPVGTRSEALDEEVLPLLYATGCRNITYAPESGSIRMLDAIKKRVKLPRLLESLRAAVRSGLVTNVNIIIGHPQELRRDLWKSFGLLLRAALIGCQSSSVMIYAPYPGSADFEDLLRRGEVEVSGDYYYLALKRTGFSSTTYNPRMGTSELIVMRNLMLLSYYTMAYVTRPGRILRLLTSLLTGKEETMMDQFLRTKRRQLSGAFKRVAIYPLTRIAIRR